MFNAEFPVQIIRTNRTRSASIRIVNHAVEVVVPRSLSEKRIEELVKQRTPWIKKKLRLALQTPLHKPKEYVNGESFSYLGRNYRLKLNCSESNATKLKNGYLQVSESKKLSEKEAGREIKTSLENWYKSHALRRLQDKCNRYGQIVGMQPNSIKVKNFKSRWGSCSVDGDITFNWRIILAPHQIVDYVVVHELCHLLEHNHSPKYWKLVETVVPAFRDSRAWLKINGGSLFI